MKTNVDGEKKMTASPFKFHLLQQKNTHNIYTNTHIYTSIFFNFYIFPKIIFFFYMVDTNRWRAWDISTHVLLITKLHSRDFFFPTVWKHDWHTVFLVAKSKWEHPHNQNKVGSNNDYSFGIWYTDFSSSRMTHHWLNVL